MAQSPTLYLDVWSDYVCPFCYLETPVLADFRNAYGDAVEIRWHSFLLRPEAVSADDDGGESRMQMWERNIYPMADERALTMRMPAIESSSDKAQEAAAFARATGQFEALHAALYKAYFEDGLDIGDADTLIDIGSAVGLDPEALDEALADGSFKAAVREDVDFAEKLGITSVPFIVLSRDPAPGQDTPPNPIAIRGAAPIEHFESAVQRLFPDGFPEI